MKRKQILYLKEWKDRDNRRPLIIRGARQVGKTYLVRQFANQEFENLLEINFDLTPSKAKIFENSNIDEILKLLAIDNHIDIIPGKTLLFFDEIQATPQIIAKLRYFYELKPELHIISAGSLLDFTLANHEYSMPVGRIEYMFMGPMLYSEFLLANNENALLDYITDYSLPNQLPPLIHNKCLKYLKHYFFTGGMPAAVKAYISKDFNAVSFEHKIIIQTFMNDFSKYKKRCDTDLLRTVFTKIPTLVGNKIKYVNISQNHKAAALSEALSLLSMAKILHSVYHSSCNGVPLAGELNEKIFKTIFLDIGLLLSILKLSISDLELEENLITVNSGALAEQFIGQHLLSLYRNYEEPHLYYWHRMKNGASSEIDYAIENNRRIIPIEVKAGKTGSLKSLQVFVSKKDSDIAVRFNADLPSTINTKTSIPKISDKEYKLLSLPLYMVEELPKILSENI
ncbi:MAG: AAA family ATPase [Verrucomicrobiota bacterium]|nr:AAA family ATPase [Verrucomicrobiota bacterium]